MATLTWQDVARASYSGVWFFRWRDTLLDVYFGRDGAFPEVIRVTSSIFLYPSTTRELRTFAGVVMS